MTSTKWGRGDHCETYGSKKFRIFISAYAESHEEPRNILIGLSMF